MGGGRIFLHKPQLDTSLPSPEKKPAPKRRAFADEEPRRFPERKAPGFNLLSVPAYGPEGERPHPLVAVRGQELAIQRELQAKIRAKLKMGPVDDPLEREADRVADAVVDASAATPTTQGATANTVQRKCAACEEEDTETLMQRKPDGAAVAQAPASVGQVLSSPGRPLDAATREFMEPRFGHDLSEVRIHDDAAAHESASEVRANAYTVGRDIAFGRGQYQPETTEGQRLLAHELTHVVQQHGGSATIAPAPTQVARDVGISESNSVESPERVEVQALQPAEIRSRWATQRAKFIRVASDPLNALGAKQMYEIWLQSSREEHRVAEEEFRGIESELFAADPVGFADKKMMFSQGRHDALGPKYAAAADRFASIGASFSDLEFAMSWLEAREVNQQHVTLAQLNEKAREHARAGAKYRDIMMNVIFTATALGAAGAAPRGAKPVPEARGGIPEPGPTAARDTPNVKLAGEATEGELGASKEASRPNESGGQNAAPREPSESRPARARTAEERTRARAGDDRQAVDESELRSGTNREEGAGAHATSPDGEHEVYVLKDGRIFRCTLCADIEIEFRKTLEQLQGRPDTGAQANRFLTRLEELQLREDHITARRHAGETIAANEETAVAQAIARLDQELREFVAKEVRNVEAPGGRAQVPRRASPRPAAGRRQGVPTPDASRTSASNAEPLGPELPKTGGNAPQLTATTNPELMKQAMDILRETPPAQRIEKFESLLPDIDRLGGGFVASRQIGSDGSSIYLGTTGQALVIKPSGEVYRGRLGGDALVPFGETGSTMTPVYDKLKQVL